MTAGAPREPVYTVRVATAADAEAIRDLVARSLGTGLIPRSSEYWDWKHHQNPFGPSFMLVGEHDGTLVGLRAFMRWDWYRSGQRVPAVRAVDTATHPDWRGRGIFSTLTRALVEQVRDAGVSFIFNTPNDKSRPGYLKMGWTTLGRLDVQIKPLRYARLARSAFGAARPEPDVATADDARSAAALAEHPRLSRILTGDDDRLHTRIDASYLRWRYAQVPGIAYQATHCLDEEGAAAILWRLKSGPRGLRELRVCDILLADHPQSVRNAAQLLRDLARRSGADYASAMTAAGSVTHAVLRSARFLQIRRVGPIFTVRDLAKQASPVDPTVLHNWHPSIGALELF